MKPYLSLEEKFRTLNGLEGAIAMLHWDHATVMPVGSASARAEQLATLQSLHHGILTSPQLADLLDEAEGLRRELDNWQQANLRLMRHKWKHANAVDSRLVVAHTHASSECEMAWREARKRNDFAAYAPLQQKVVDLTREMALAKGEAFGCSPYAAMLDKYDVGREVSEIDAVFSELTTFLPSFLQNVLENQRSAPAPEFPFGPFAVDKQKKLGTVFMQALGFDFERGRLDESTHPFCGGVPDDVRITSRYDIADFTSGLMGILHESGHALYEQNLPKAWRGQPVGEVHSMTMHESQSLLIEMQVCRGRDFLQYAAPVITEILGGEGTAWEADNFRRLYSRVEPGLIRVDADEITYPLHIILRYRIEQQLVAGALQVKDIPAMWNTGMKELLGIDVTSDRDGCMQDIHWTDGSFGYFPTYTLGAMYAAQFFHTAREKNPEIVRGIRKGDFAPLKNWLRENIHEKASLLTPGELLKQATGEPLNAEIYKNHLKNRYLS